MRRRRSQIFDQARIQPGADRIRDKNKVAVLPGALTPTEVISAWQAGADFVKVFPCAQVGGDKYIKALKAALPWFP